MTRIIVMKTDKSDDFIKSGRRLITDQDSDKLLSGLSEIPKHNVTKINARISTQDSNTISNNSD